MSKLKCKEFRRTAPSHSCLHFHKECFVTTTVLFAPEPTPPKPNILKLTGKSNEDLEVKCFFVFVDLSIQYFMCK